MYLARVYETLLRLYPERHQALFAEEMLAVFEEAAAEHRERGWLTFAAFALREIAGLMVGSSVERMANFANADRPTPVRDTVSDELTEAQERVTFILRRMEYAIAHHQFQRARFYSNEEFKEREKLRQLEERCESGRGK